MQVVLLQILQWILRIILLLLLLLGTVIVIVMIVPIRYKAEGEFIEKKPGIRGKVTWFFYLIHMKFSYEEEFRIIVRLFGFKVYDSLKSDGKSKKKSSEINNDVQSNLSNEKNKEEIVNDKNNSEIDAKHTSQGEKQTQINQNKEYDLADLEKEMEAEDKAEAKLAKQVIQNQAKSDAVSSNIASENTTSKTKKSFSERLEELKIKILDVVEKLKSIIQKIQDGRLKVEHYLELWNRKETQITFQRAKKKLGKVLKAILPRKWEVNAEVGFADPATTGKLLGAMGAMYPVLGNHVKLIPDFENEVMKLEGRVKGHVTLGKLTYQLVSLLLNVHCFKLIKLIFDELGGSKKKKKNS